MTVKMSGGLTKLSAMLKPKACAFGESGHDVEILDACTASTLAQIIEARDQAYLLAISRSEQVQSHAVAWLGVVSQQDFTIPCQPAYAYANAAFIMGG
jgi:hypothetical protein